MFSLQNSNTKHDDITQIEFSPFQEKSQQKLQSSGDPKRVTLRKRSLVFFTWLFKVIKSLSINVLGLDCISDETPKEYEFVFSNFTTLVSLKCHWLEPPVFFWCPRFVRFTFLNQFGDFLSSHFCGQKNKSGTWISNLLFENTSLRCF